MRDLRSVVDEIHSKVDIVEFIGKYVKLKKQGSNYVGLCPFHKEKTPSFVVSPLKQLYHCFGCGASGDVITFLMHIENLPFKDAVRQIAESANIEMPVFSHIETEDRDILASINNEIAQYFQDNLKEEHLSYLRMRGVSVEAIKKYRIGFAPPDSFELCKVLLEKGFKKEHILKTGNFKVDASSQLSSYFRNRIMIPIFDLANNIVGFSGRSFDGAEPKYLNSLDSPIFKKGELLYLLNFSKEHIRDKKEAIIVEGYFDAIILYENGVKNVVSSMGTSFTETQAKILRRFANKLYFFFDNDTGGRTGAERAVEVCNNLELTAYVVTQKEDLDPDEIVIKYGSSPIYEMLKNAVDPVFFILDFEMSKTDGSIASKSQAIKKVLEVVSNIENKTIVYEYISEIARRLKFDEKFLVDTFSKINSAKKGNKNDTLPNVVKNKMIEIQEVITQAILTRSEKAKEILAEFNINEFNEPYKKIVMKALEDIENGFEPNPNRWFDLDEFSLNKAVELFLRDEFLVRDESIKANIASFQRIKQYEERLEELYEALQKTDDPEKISEFNRLVKAYKRRVRL
uniref:DNA primase n=1 Tax=Caldisericum exile TaxID=693075 RepID=A0A7C4U323_9BACT